jgi:pimeloyl-ACP methyl ester carboxylesterase
MVARGHSHTYALAAALAAVVLLAGCGRQSPTSPLARATSAAHAPAGLATISGEAVHLEGEIGPGALYSLDKPAEWNGDLVLYLHGYSNPSAPIGLPNNGAIRDRLLAEGFAVAASSFSENGYAVPEAMRQSHQLRGLFVSQVAKPNRVFLFGVSLGGIIGMELAEKFPQQYDGAFLASGVVGGTRAELEYISDTKVLFDVLFPTVHLGGLYDPIPLTNPTTQLIIPVSTAVQANPTNLGILNLITRHPLAGNNGTELTTTLITVLGFQMQGAGDLLGRTHGHGFFDNTGHAYTGPLPPAVTDPINAGVARFQSTADARAWMDHYGEPSGELRIPVLTIHNTRDPVVPFFHEGLLASAVAASGYSDNLVQRSKNSYGHVDFTTNELAQNFLDMVHWVDTGVKP